MARMRYNGDSFLSYQAPQTVNRAAKGNPEQSVNRAPKGNPEQSVNRAAKGNPEQSVNRSAKRDLPKVKAIASKPVSAAPKPKLKPTQVIRTTVTERPTPVKKPNAYQSMMKRAEEKGGVAGPRKTGGGLNAKFGFSFGRKGK